METLSSLPYWFTANLIFAYMIAIFLYELFPASLCRLHTLR